MMLALATEPSLDLYIGTYTSPNGSRGIYHAQLELATGKLSEPALAVETANPSYLAVHPNGQLVYAVHEDDAGEVSGYRIEADGTLRLLNTKPSGGAATCYLAVTPDGKDLLTASYMGGFARLPIGADGALGTPQEFRNAGSGPNKGRQEGPHPHMIATDPLGRFGYACDLGTDEVLRFDVGPHGRLERLGSTKITAGGGPRHFVFTHDGRFVFVNEEMGNAVGAYRVEHSDGTLFHLETVSSLPNGADEKGVSTAEIAVHPSGRWLYVSNRGHDSLAVYGIEPDGRLIRLEVVSAGVREPRGFAVDPTGRWLVAAGQKSHDLVSLPIDQTTGRLGAPESKVAVPTPVCVAFRLKP